MASQLPNVSILLVNYNGRDHLGPCLDSIAALDYPSHLLETILVDNASADGSLQLLADTYPWVKVLPQSSNLGFAPAVNMAAAMSTGEALALINNDMRIRARTIAKTNSQEALMPPAGRRMTRRRMWWSK